MTPSPLPSISVDSRPLLRVYYSQPPTLLSSPAISLLSLCGSCLQSQERSKSFTELQSARKAQNKGERERQRETDRVHTRQHHYRPTLCLAVHLLLQFYSAQAYDVETAACTDGRNTSWLSLQVKLICTAGPLLHAAISQLHWFHDLISYVHLFCHLPYAEIFRGERVAFARSSFPLFMDD